MGSRVRVSSGPQEALKKMRAFFVQIRNELFEMNEAQRQKATKSGPTGFDSKDNGFVSTQVHRINNLNQGCKTIIGENTYALAA